MKKLSLITLVIFILSLVQNFFFPASARAAADYEPTSRGISPTFIGENDPNKGLPWIKINPNGSYETPDKYSSVITIVDVNHADGSNLYTIKFSNGATTNLTCNYDSENKEVSWSSTIPLMYVFVKASVGGLLYDYSSHEETLDDSKLLTPYTKNGPPAGLSHVNFYFDPKPSVQHFGSLKVKKIFDDGASNIPATFTLKGENVYKVFSLKNNEEFTVNGLSLNKEYVLSEKPLEGYKAYINYELIPEGGYVFKLTEDKEMVITVNNKKDTIPPLEKKGSLKIKKLYEGEGTHPAANFILKDEDGKAVKEFALLNNEEIVINDLSLNKEYILYEAAIEGYEALIIDSSSKEVKLTSAGYAFNLTESGQLSLVVKNKKNATEPEDKPVINPVKPEVLPQTGSMFGDLLPLLGFGFLILGIVVFKGIRSFK